MLTMLKTGALISTSLAAALARRAIGRRRRPSWSAWTEAVFGALQRDVGPLMDTIRDPVAIRRAMDRPRAPAQTSRKLTISEAWPEAAWFIPPGAPEDAALVYLHGGGFVLGSWRTTHKELIAAIALASKLRVFALDYRLAPEHPFPAALDDIREALGRLRSGEAGGAALAPERIVLAGDSAGGNLALGALLDARERGDPMPAGAWLLSPVVDFVDDWPSRQENAAWDYLRPSFIDWTREQYLGGADRASPRVSPLRAELSGLPPLLLQAGGAELLLDEGRAFAEAAAEAGVDARFALYPDMVHVWHLAEAFVPEARRAIAEGASFVQGLLGS